MIVTARSWGKILIHWRLFLLGRFFDDIKERGLIDVKLIISYRHKGIQKTVRETFLGLIWKMCYLHLIRQVLKKVTKEAKKGIMKLKEASIDHPILI